MAWRGLHLTQPSRLTLADGQIVVGQEDGDARVPIEDTAWIVVDSPRTTLTASLVAACMDAGVALVFTDARHTPSGLLLPFHRHHLQADVAALQAAASAPLRKRLWQQIVRRKIENQAAVLDAVGAPGANGLRETAKRVGSGDPGNLEAQAARAYWRRLWPDFVREDAGDRRNAMLNYGYAVLRAGVARALVATGLLPCFGLHHASVSNAFNLADDLLEPFRPFVDERVWRAVEGRPSRDEMTVADRRALAGVLLDEASVGRETTTLLTATELGAQSIVRALQIKSPAGLVLPRLERGGLFRSASPDSAEAPAP